MRLEPNIVWLYSVRMSEFTFYGGVDFSGAKPPLSNIWTAVGIVAPADDGAEDGDRLQILDLRPHAYREDLAAFIGEGAAALGDLSTLPTLPDSGPPALWGMDYPFSLGDGVARAILPDWDGTWRDSLPRLTALLPDELKAVAQPHQKTRRAIDTGSAKAPLDLRLIRQTHEGLRLLETLMTDAGATVLPFQDASAPAGPTLIEVYPTLTARDLGITGRRPARPGDAAARPQKLAPHLSFAHPSMAASAAALEDAWDAVLACLTAFLVRNDLDQPFRVGSHPPEVIRNEGWIYRHPQMAGG